MEKEIKLKKILNENSNYFNYKAFLYILNDKNTANELLNKINFEDSDEIILQKVKSFHEELKERTAQSINKLIKDMDNNNKFDNNVKEIKLNKIISNIEYLEEKKRETSEEIKAVYSEAKSMGYDVKISREVIKIQKLEIYIYILCCIY